MNEEPFLKIWLKSRRESGYGIDQASESVHRLGLFVQGVETAILGYYPHLKLPSIAHLKLLTALCILPPKATVTSFSSIYVGGLKSSLVSGFLSNQCIRLLETIGDWRFHKQVSNLSNEVSVEDNVKHELSTDNDVENYQYDQFRSIFIPEDNERYGGVAGGNISSYPDENKRSLRTGTRINYTVFAEISPKKKPFDANAGNGSSVSTKRRYREKTESGDRSSSNPEGKREQSEEKDGPSDEFDESMEFNKNLVDPNIYMNQGLFSDARQIWGMIGWAFTCSTIDDPRYIARWKHWSKFLSFLFDLLEKDYELCEKIEFGGLPIIQSWVEPVHHSVVFDSIFATISRDKDLKFKPIFAHEIPSEDGDSYSFGISSQQSISSSQGDSRKLRPGNPNLLAMNLRSRILGLVLKQQFSESSKSAAAVKTLQDTCYVILNDSWKYSVLLGSLIVEELIKSDSNASIQELRINSSPNLISRMAWTTALLPQSLDKYWVEYVRVDNTPPSMHALIELLKCSPRSNIVVDPFDAFWGITCLILNNIDDIYPYLLGELDMDSDLPDKLTSAFEEGHNRRRAWFDEKQQKKDAKNWNKTRRQVNTLLEEIKSAITDIVTAMTGIYKEK